MKIYETSELPLSKISIKGIGQLFGQIQWALDKMNCGVTIRPFSILHEKHNPKGDKFWVRIYKHGKIEPGINFPLTPSTKIPMDIPHFLEIESSRRMIPQK